MKTNNNQNQFLTSDIRISKDSGGYYDADHKFQGELYQGCIFNTRQEARRAAVEDLKNIKEYQSARDTHDCEMDY